MKHNNIFCYVINVYFEKDIQTSEDEKNPFQQMETSICNFYGITAPPREVGN